MPLGFSGGQWLAQMGERYGEKLARGIIDAGAKIEQGLMRVTTNKQLAGLGETLGQLNPQSPDYAQKIIQIAPNFPMAMQDPRGQAMVAIGAKANAQWQASQAAQLRLGQQLQNQKTMQGIRQTDELARINARNQGRANNEVDLINTPGQLRPQNPATVSGFGTDEEMANQPEEMPAGAPLNVNDVPLGLPPLPENISPANRGALRSAPTEAAPIPESEAAPEAPDPLVERALKPLREAQRVTGVKPSRSQVVSAIASERAREERDRLQEDRQKASEEAAAKRDEMAAKRLESSEKRFLTTLEQGQVKSEISSIERDIPALRREVISAKKAMDEFVKGMSDSKEDIAKRREFEGAVAEAQSALEAAGKERERLQGMLGSAKKTADQIFKTEEEALAAGFKVGDEVMLINPRTGKPARAILE